VTDQTDHSHDADPVFRELFRFAGSVNEEPTTPLKRTRGTKNVSSSYLPLHRR
jgi:hypothetical protein